MADQEKIFATYTKQGLILLRYKYFFKLLGKMDSTRKIDIQGKKATII